MLDFVVVVSGWLGVFVKGGNISAIRTVRILRPLRTVNSLPEMKTLVVSILSSLPMLMDICVLFVFILLVFGIVGTQLYVGTYRRRCGDETGELNPDDVMCYFESGCDGDNGDMDCMGGGCKKGSEFPYCTDNGENPNTGVTSFDNTLISILTVFVMITLEGWTDVMYMSRDVTGNPREFNDIFFIVVVVIGAFFVLNLVAAVLIVNYDAVNKKNMEALGDTKKLKRDTEERITEEPPRPHSDSGCIYAWWRVRIWHYYLVEHKYFSIFIFALIISNTVIMASEYYEMSDAHEEFVETSNLILNIIFAMEMTLKLIGLGYRGYVADKFNMFDGFIVIVGLIEIIFLSGGNVRGLLVLRAFRLLRIFKLARGWRSLRILLEKIIEATKKIAYLGVLTLLCLFIYALMGKQFFEGKLEDRDGEVPRANFDHLFWAFITIFQILTGENWNENLYSGIDNEGWLASLYFVSLLMIGAFILLNLFMAILTGEFEGEEEEDEDEDEDLDNEGSKKPSQDSKSLVNKVSDKKRKEELKTSMTQKSIHVKDPIPLLGRSFLMFGPENCLRNMCKRMLLNPHFDAFIYGLIGISSVFLALQEPKLTPYTDDVLVLGDRVVLGLFIMEFLVKAITLQAFWGKDSYIKNSWNRLDFFIICVSVADLVISLLAGGVDLSFLRALRALRALRPLRMISHNEKMKKIVNSLFRALPVVINISLISILFYLIFGILGVIFFKGAFFACAKDPDFDLPEDSELDPGDEMFNNKTACNGMDGLIWANSDVNFDNIFISMLTLFEIATLEMWPDFMYLAVDAVGPGEPMERDVNQLHALFFVAFIFVTVFFIMNLYVGAVINKFNEIQKEQDGSYFLDDDQKEWVKTQRLLAKCSPRIRYIPPRDPLRKALFNFVLDSKFDTTVMIVIVLNIVFMSLSHYKQASELDEISDIANLVFILIFTLEWALKTLGLGVRYYFASAWNTFDFIIVVLSYLSMFNLITFFNATVLRALRIGRLFRMIKSFKGFRKVFETLLSSLPALFNVGTLLLLLFFVYSIAGMSLLGDVKHQDFITEHVNFEGFYNSMNTLFRCSTGESWNGIMHDCMERELCRGNCGSVVVAPLFFVSFNVIAAFLFLNIFVAIMLENFTDSDGGDSVELNGGDFKKFQNIWSRFAPYGEHFIDTIELPSLVEQLDSPLGFKGQKLSKGQLLSLIDTFNIRDHDGKVHFIEVLWALANAVSGADMTWAPRCEAVEMIKKQIPLKYPTLKTNPKEFMSNRPPRDHLAASKVIAAWNIYKAWKQRSSVFVIPEEQAMEEDNDLEDFYHH